MSEPHLVIVRAYGDEPVVMEAVSFDPSFVVVRRPKGDGTALRLSYEWVYRHTPSRYRTLRETFRYKGRDALVALWVTTPPRSASSL